MKRWTIATLGAVCCSTVVDLDRVQLGKFREPGHDQPGRRDRHIGPGLASGGRDTRDDSLRREIPHAAGQVCNRPVPAAVHFQHDCDCRRWRGHT